jgi:hypothetical protein
MVGLLDASSSAGGRGCRRRWMALTRRRGFSVAAFALTGGGGSGDGSSPWASFGLVYIPVWLWRLNPEGFQYGLHLAPPIKQVLQFSFESWNIYLFFKIHFTIKETILSKYACHACFNKVETSLCEGRGILFPWYWMYLKKWIYISRFKRKL